MMNKWLILGLCGAVIVLTSIALYYYMYQLILMDAESRGMKRPKLWAVFASGGQNGSGLFIYLFSRRKTTSLLSQNEVVRFEGLKRKIYCLLGLALTIFLIFVAVVLRMK